MVSRETRLIRFADALFEANKGTNLVSRKLTQGDIRALVLAFAGTLSALGLGPTSGVLDIGSGGGLPGIPLAIADPSTRVVLAEARKLRVAWLHHVVGDLGLDNVTVVGGRVQDYPELEGAFPTVTAFGVGRVAETLVLCLPYLSNDGVAVLSAPGTPTKADEGRWLLAAAVNGAKVVHHRSALTDGRALVTVRRDPRT